MCKSSRGDTVRLTGRYSEELLYCDLKSVLPSVSVLGTNELGRRTCTPLACRYRRLTQVPVLGPAEHKQTPKSAPPLSLSLSSKLDIITVLDGDGYGHRYYF